jgi:DNA-binding HxlR family transcriptional regulator
MKQEKKTKPERRSDCAVACTLDVIGDRWTLLVVRDLLGGKRHFDDFLRSPEGIATNVLSARLRALCQQGWVKKTPDPSDHRRYTYQLSDDGLRLGELRQPRCLGPPKPSRNASSRRNQTTLMIANTSIWCPSRKTTYFRLWSALVPRKKWHALGH